MRRLSHEPAPGRRLALTESVLLMLAFAVLDWGTGTEASVFVVYLLPVAVAAWHVGRAAGVGLAALCGVCWLVADLLGGREYSHFLIGWWNAAMRAVAFAVVAVLVWMLRRAYDREEAARWGLGLERDGAEAFYRALDREHARLGRHAAPFTLAYVDAGGVRPDGPAHGDTGAAFAAAVLETLRGNLRATDLVARPRGKEFALLMPDTGAEAAAAALARVREALALLAAAHDPMPALAVGAVSCGAECGADVNQVIQRAYQLMYAGERTPGDAAIVLEAMPVRSPSAVTVPGLAR